MNETIQQRATMIAERRTAVAVYFELVRTRRLQTHANNRTIPHRRTFTVHCRIIDKI